MDSLNGDILTDRENQREKTSSPVTFTAIITKHPVGEQNPKLDLYLGNSLIKTVSDTTGNATLTIDNSINSSLGTIQHGINIISAQYTNPSYIEYSRDSQTIPGINTLYYCGIDRNNEYIVDNDHKSSINSKTIAAISAANTRNTSNKDNGTSLTFYGAYPIYTNSLYNGNPWSRWTSQLSNTEAKNTANIKSTDLTTNPDPDNPTTLPVSKYLWNYHTSLTSATSKYTIVATFGQICHISNGDNGARIYIPVRQSDNAEYL